MSSEHVLAVAWIVATWGLLFGICAGWGTLANRLLWGKTVSQSWLDRFWIGFACLIAFLQCWHLWLPVGGGIAFLVFTAVACMGILVGAGSRPLATSLRTFLPRGMGLILPAFWLANRASGPCCDFDTGLYYAMKVRWIAEYAIVPGLGNLYLPLAAHMSSCLVPALLEFGPWHGRTVHFVDSFLIMMLLVESLAGMWTLVGGRANNPSRMATAVYTSLFMIPALQMSNHWASSFSTDVAPAVIALVASRMLFNLLVSIGHSSQTVTDCTPAMDGRSVVPICLLLSAGVCCKMTLIGLGPLLWFVTIGSYLIKHCRSTYKGTVWKNVLAATAGSLLLIGPWLVHGVIMSGYPLYPCKHLAWNVDWRVPETELDEELTYQRQQNRLGHRNDLEALQTLCDGRWVIDWACRLERDILLPLTISLAVLMVWPKRRGWCENTAAVPGTLPWVVVGMIGPVFAAIGLWFVMQAIGRMGFFLFWILACTLVALLFMPGFCDASLLKLPLGRKSMSLQKVFVFVCVLLAVANLKKFWCMPGTDFGLHPLPKKSFVARRDAADFSVFYVVDASLAFDAPLPTTVIVHPPVHPRDPYDLQAGFAPPETRLVESGTPMLR